MGRNIGLAMAVILAGSFAGAGLNAQQAPADLTAIPPVASTYVPAKTPWGDPDLRGTWPIQHVDDAKIPIERPEELGTQAWLSDEEFAKRLEAARASDGKFSPELRDNGTQGLADWVARTELGRRTSLLVDPPDGRLPPKTPDGDARHKAGRASWVNGQAIDWIDDLDVWDRCVTPGFPAAMLPFPYENGIRIFQAPGYVVIDRAMLGARIVPIGTTDRWPAEVRSWAGSSRGHWEGTTLVIETSNMVPGDGASRDVLQRAASPIYDDPRPTPIGPEAKAVERLTMVGPDRIIYELTYTDPDVFTAPWTARLDWLRDETYQLYEFACHEGNVQIRDMINASRAQRKADAEAAKAIEAGAGNNP